MRTRWNNGHRKLYKLSSAVTCEISLSLLCTVAHWWVGSALPGCQPKMFGMEEGSEECGGGAFSRLRGLRAGRLWIRYWGHLGGVHVSLEETSLSKAPWFYLELGKRVWKQLNSFPHNLVIFGASSIIWPHKASVLGPNQGEDYLLRSCFPLHGQIKSLLGLAEVSLVPCSNYCSISERKGFNFIRVRANGAFCIYYAFNQYCKRIKRPQQALWCYLS